jgi:hypothetical protein
MLDYINARAAGKDADVKLVLPLGNKTLELSAEPVKPAPVSDVA